MAQIPHPFSHPRRLAFLFALALFCVALAASGGEIRTNASADRISIDDSFELSFEVSGSADFSPDFSPLERDFEILQQSRNQSIRMLNGDLSRSTTWLLTLMPRAVGQFDIPPIRFGADRSPPLQLQVLDSPAGAGKVSGEDLILEVEAIPEQAYVQSQILYTVRLLVATSLGNVTLRKLTAPRLAVGEAVVEPLGEDRQFRSQRGNRQYTVLERRYAIFPQHSGTLKLEPILFEGDLGRGVTDPFGMLSERFFQDRPTKIRRVRSAALELEILPVPSTAETPWIPAEHVDLAQSWSADTEQLTVGQPITRTLVLIADGLTSAQLPALAPKMALPDGLKEYPEQPSLSDQHAAAGITGTRQEKTAIIPTRPGSYILPELRIPWWNSKTNRQEIARIAQQRIQVVAAEAEESNAQPVPAPEPGGEASAESATPAAPPTSVAALWGEHDPWRWLSSFLGLGWLTTLAAWWWLSHRTRSATRQASTRPSAPPDLREAVREIRQAFAEHDSGRARQALLAWGAAAWPDAPPGGLGELAARCDGETRRRILELHRSLYSREAGDWSTYPVWQHLPPAAEPGAGTRNATAPYSPISPLNP